jgi:SAM-dependent methyltransferase
VKLFSTSIDREKYLETQITRSEAKFNYCRVSMLDALAILNTLRNHGYQSGPFICMGTRNGREMDLFRYAKRSKFLSAMTYLFEREKFGVSSQLSIIEKFGRSNIERIEEEGVYGVEINPSVRRSDTFVGSFDELPPHFEGKFSVIYSNSFDHALLPEMVVEEWRRVLNPSEGYIILDFVENDTPTKTDPLGGLRKEELAELFQAKILYYGERSAFDPMGKINRLILKR